MRVILKPAGLLILVASFAALAWMVTLLYQALQEKKEARIGSEPTLTAELQNPGFEEDYRPPVNYGLKARLSGYVAYPWKDDSSWSPVSVTYQQDTDRPHGGKSSQRITVTDVPTNVEARVQFCQPLALARGKKYRGAVWLRADAPVEVDLMLRQEKEPYRYFGTNKVPVGISWQKAEVTGTVTEDGNSYLMLKVSKPATFWVDDASVTEVGPGG